MRSKIQLSKLPRIACVSAEALTPSHGTGMMFSRHFSRYPKSKIIDMHFQSFANRYHFQKISVPRHDLLHAPWDADWLKDTNSCLKGENRRPGLSLIYKNKVFAPIDVDWDKYGGPPDLIYSTCFSGGDFAFLHHVYRNLPKKVPIIQHFLDLDMSHYDEMVALYRELSPAIVAVWALTWPIWHAVAQFSDLKPEIVQALQQPLSKVHQKKHRDFSPDFETLIIGNIWSGSAYKTLRTIWEGCQKQLPKLAPISWSGHPRRFMELKHMKIDTSMSSRDRVIRDAGFLSAPSLNKRLREADIAIVAFSGDYVDKEHYTRYSLPSRIGDYCAHGLPLVIISRRDTEPWRIVEENKMGLNIDPSHPKEGIRKLVQFIQDPDARAECGRNARLYAERELNLQVYQSQLYPRLLSYSRQKLGQRFLHSRFPT